MKSCMALLVWLLVYGLAMGVASNTVKWLGVRALVRYAPPLTEMARCRFRGLAYGRGEPTRVNGLGPALFVVAPWGCWAPKETWTLVRPVVPVELRLLFRRGSVCGCGGNWAPPRISASVVSRPA